MVLTGNMHRHWCLCYWGHANDIKLPPNLKPNSTHNSYHFFFFAICSLQTGKLADTHVPAQTSALSSRLLSFSDLRSYCSLIWTEVIPAQWSSATCSHLCSFCLRNSSRNVCRYLKLSLIVEKLGSHDSWNNIPGLKHAERANPKPHNWTSWPEKV